MLKPIVSSILLIAGAVTPTLIFGAETAEITEIRKELEQLKQQYESRIRAMELLLKNAELKGEVKPGSLNVTATPVDASSEQAFQSAPPMDAGTGLGGRSRASAAAFNPAISLVLQGRYASLSQDPDRYAISGFMPGGEIGPGVRGFSLAETELTLSANVDERFFGQSTLAVSPENEIAVEEAYVSTTALGAGIGLKAGRFFSALGYQNEQHQHAWDFIDAPLAYQAFLGGQHGNDGIQVKWIAPLDWFFELGAEIGSGSEFPGTPRNKNGVGASALTARLGGDFNESTSWRIGLSGLRARPKEREFVQTDLAGNDAMNTFSGDSRLAIIDFVIKYAPGGNSSITNFKLQGEYFRRTEKGDLTYDSDGSLTGVGNTDAFRARQSGWYLQGIYQYLPKWRVGLRYDRLNPGSVNLASNAANLGALAFRPQRTALMVDWSPSEFSRIRLQGTRERSLPQITDNQIFLQYIMTIGAHGAHAF